ncbi:MAG: PLP-dependent aminotransferase family protein [Candidatus Heimdallarchaeota archaeon]|nr:MAG: PLP-dependent aminotransferase family protein [Candidatus Heimdallarchaeota archaeon]
MKSSVLVKSDHSSFLIKYADWVKKLPESEIRRLLRFSPKYYFSGGKPGILPVDTFHQIMEEIISEERILLKRKDSKVLEKYNYGATEGNVDLRTILANRLRKRDHVSCSAEDVLITAGSQQTLFAINDCLINPGDIILTTRPTYLGFLLPAEKFGAIIVTLPSDDGGLMPEFIDSAVKLCKQKFNKVPKILYTIPYSDNPKGTTLSSKRKQQIIDIVFSYNDLLIVEDVAYKEIQFGKTGNYIRPLKENDPENQRIAYLSTSTKEAASFRMGYSVLPEGLRHAMVKAKGYYDLCSSEFVQAILARYYEKYIDLTLPLIRQGYEERCKAMVKAIKEYMPDGSSTNPTGGFFVWFEAANQDFDSHSFVQKAIEKGVAYVPGFAFYPQFGYAVTEDSKLVRLERPTNSMRIGYSLLSPKFITDGIKLLGKLMKEETRKVPSKFSTFMV